MIVVAAALQDISESRYPNGEAANTEHCVSTDPHSMRHAYRASSSVTALNSTDRAPRATVIFFFFKQKTAYEIDCDWSSHVCSSDLRRKCGLICARNAFNSACTAISRSVA